MRSHHPIDADVRTRLSALIVELELTPGTLVSEGSLLTRLDCTRSELRDVVLDLRESGLVNVVPRAGIAITDIGVTDIRHVLEARLAIETYCARLAAIRATPADVQALQALSDELAQLSRDEGDWGMAYVDLDREIHAGVARVARNPILERTLGRLLLANARIWNLFFARAQSGHFRVSHQDTVDAIARHDPDAAEESVRRHIGRASQMLSETLDPLVGMREAAERPEVEALPK